MPNGKQPNVYIIAGPNGSGKTTFATTFLPDYAHCDEFVNPDLIARGISPFSPANAAIKAGRILLEQIRELSEKKVDFAFETTLSGLAYLNWLKHFRKMGYSIHIFYLWVADIDLALARIKERVQRGGHHVPSMDVRRRYKRSIHNLFQKYAPLVDSWTLFDNSSGKPRVIAQDVGRASMIIREPELFDKIRGKSV